MDLSLSMRWQIQYRKISRADPNNFFTTDTMLWIYSDMPDTRFVQKPAITYVIPALRSIIKSDTVDFMTNVWSQVHKPSCQLTRHQTTKCTIWLRQDHLCVCPVWMPHLRVFNAHQYGKVPKPTQTYKHLVEDYTWLKEPNNHCRTNTRIFSCPLPSSNRRLRYAELDSREKGQALQRREPEAVTMVEILQVITRRCKSPFSCPHKHTGAGAIPWEPWGIPPTRLKMSFSFLYCPEHAASHKMRGGKGGEGGIEVGKGKGRWERT